MRNTNFFKSLRHAMRGFADACAEERNLRFHCFAGAGVCLFALFYGLCAEQWAILALTVSAVISTELANTATERTVDTATDEIKESARLAKDAAAGAVLVTVVGAIAVGICLFSDAEKITYTVKTIASNAKYLGLFTGYFVVGGGFLLFGGKGDKNE